MVVTALVIAVGYFGIYKKLCKGKREIKLVRLFWWLMLIIYLFVVLSVTLFRTSVFQNGQIISFCYSYKEAWISASETAWRNIILNILMFVPLGFWLPLGKEKFRVFWKTYLVGFLFTVAIESLQLILSLGLFEVADLFNNTLGTMIGYGLYKVVESFVLLFKKEKVKVARMLAGQIPLVFAVCMFTGIFWAYQKQELGNLLIECVSPYPEEMNRQITGRIASYHFAPTELSKHNLLKEGIEDKFIFVTLPYCHQGIFVLIYRYYEKCFDFFRRHFLSLYKGDESI